MHDFDKSQRARHAQNEIEFGERSFTFRGEVFYVRANVGYPAIKRMAEINENTEGTAVFERVEKAVLAMIDPRDKAYERFEKVIESADFPVTFEDLNELNTWLIQESTGRPPTQPESSVTGLQIAGTKSTGTSFDEPAPA